MKVPNMTKCKTMKQQKRKNSLIYGIISLSSTRAFECHFDTFRQPLLNSSYIKIICVVSHDKYFVKTKLDSISDTLK